MRTYFMQIRFGSPAYDEAIKLRHELLREPLDLTFQISDILQETSQMHYGLFHDATDELLACASLVPEDTKWKLRQVAVSPEYQNKGLGRLLIRNIEIFAEASKIHEIYCHARLSVSMFYERLEYSKIGEIFSEVSIPHIKMIKKLG